MAENENPTADGAETTAPVVAATPAPAPAPSAPAVEGSSERVNRRKVREGVVLSTSMDKTTVVAVTERVRHPKYSKTVQRTRKLYAHDEDNQSNPGDRVRIAETRPLSKLKRWRLVEIVERAR
jgi:small subunit ribosomal protein S17